MMFNHSRNVVANRSTFNVIYQKHQHSLSGLSFLNQRIAHEAIHDSADQYPPPKCHPETRKSVVADILDQATRFPHVWLNGPAGAGKTALAQTICENFQKSGQLGGSFFFPRRTQRPEISRHLFLTIAYQLAVFSPKVGATIEKVVASDPAILDKSIEVQFQRLIIEPLKVNSLPESPIVIVIDALDQCEGEKMQCHILRVLGSAALDSTPRICFIVTSRPEPWIRDEFHSDLLFRKTYQISLEQSLDADEDIRTVFRDGFKSIQDSPKHKQAMRNISEPWPSERILDGLVERASGQFIYPATILKFVGDPYHRPTDQLDNVTKTPLIATPTQNPLAALDELYIQILSTSVDKKLTLKILGTFIAMLSSNTSLGLQWRLRNEFLQIAEKLLNLRPGEGYRALRTIHSLVKVSDQQSAASNSNGEPSLVSPSSYHSVSSLEDSVRFHHRSFSDFLLDRVRAGDNFIDLREINGLISLACLRVIESSCLRPPISVDDSERHLLAVTSAYANLHWIEHCTCSGAPRREIIQALKRFNSHCCFLRALGCSSRGTDSQPFLSRLGTTLRKFLYQLHLRTRGIHPACHRSTVVLEKAFAVGLGAVSDSVVLSAYGGSLRRLLSWLEEASNPQTKLMKKYERILKELPDVDSGT